MFRRYWSQANANDAKWKLDGIDVSLNDDERYWQMRKRKWICASCGKANLQHHPSMRDGTDGIEYSRVRFLEDGTPLCFDCILPLDNVKLELEARILKLHPDWIPQPPVCFICDKSGRNMRMELVKDKGLAHLECLKEYQK